MSCMQLLQQAGADVNAATRQGDTPLHAAAQTGQAAAIRQLHGSGQLQVDAANMVRTFLLRAHCAQAFIATACWRPALAAAAAC